MSLNLNIRLVWTDSFHLNDGVMILFEHIIFMPNAVKPAGLVLTIFVTVNVQLGYKTSTF